jgi:two-component system, OmpR family, aerobic respiration control sensor histidine kinase ArcB
MKDVFLPPQVPEDPDRLTDLLALVGHDGAQALLDQIAADLHSAQAGLAAAQVTGDWAGLRDHSHVVIAVAGTIGATGLCRTAREVNVLAHARDSKGLDAVLPVMMDRLTATLIWLKGHGGAP